MIHIEKLRKMDYFAQQDRNSMIENWLSSSSNHSKTSKSSVSGFVEEKQQESRQDFDHNHNNGG